MENKHPDSYELNPETWVHDYSNYLYKIAYVRLGNASVAEDVVQETLLGAWKSRERYDGSRPVKYWLRGILKHKIVDHIRKASRGEVAIEDTPDGEIIDSLSYKVWGVPLERPDEWAFNPRKAAENSEFMEVLYMCLSKMKGKVKDAFVLKELEGWKSEDICKELDVEANHFWVLCHRARGQLKTCLEKNYTESVND